jgi:hypothetical protein
MSARRAWNGGGNSAGNEVANDEDFAPIPASSFDAGCKEPPHLHVLYPADIGEVLSVAEDLWLRIARHHAVRSAVLTDTSTGEGLVMFRPIGYCRDREGYQLLCAASVKESYWWRQDGNKGSLISDVQWRGDTLMIELTPTRQLHRWPDGDAAQWAIRGLLQRIKQLAVKP